jgi:SUN domain-containing protein 1/2
MMTTTAAENSDVHRIVKLAIAKYDADKTGIADLALEPAGGSVVSTRCTKSSVKRTSVYTFFGLPFWHPPNNPRTIIQPGAVPGECWSYEGAEGFIVIQLIAPSIVHGFTLEHIPKALSPFGHIESAPKNFQVVGLMDYNNVETEFLFGSYTYEDNGEPIQYFPVQFESKQAFPFIELKIQSNHGSIEFTCVYRFRVHGQLTNSKSVPVEFKEPITYPDPV